MSENEVFIQLPVPTGRAHDDHLNATERAFCDALVEFSPDRLRVLFHEVLARKELVLEAEELLLDGEA
jgi:hypothetical protein